MSKSIQTKIIVGKFTVYATHNKTVIAGYPYYTYDSQSLEAAQELAITAAFYYGKAFGQVFTQLVGTEFERITNADQLFDYLEKCAA